MCLKFLFLILYVWDLKISQLVLLINYLNGNQDGLNNIPKSEVNLNLKIHGILFEENKIIIANKHPKLDQIFKEPNLMAAMLQLLDGLKAQFLQEKDDLQAESSQGLGVFH